MSVSLLESPNPLDLFCGSLSLPTSGGTPTPLNYYEEYTALITFTGAISGATNPSSIVMKIVRVGSQVTIEIPEFTASASGSATSINTTGGPIPARFRLSFNSFIPCTCVATSNSTQITTPCLSFVNTLGDIYIWAGWGAGNNFSTTGTNGITTSLSFTYTVL